MSTDLRALMNDLAESLPYTGNDVALADRSFSAGRRRRRIRRLEITSGAAVVALIALFGGLFLGSAPLAARYGSSGGSTVHDHPSRIGRQFPVLGLPRTPGPAAGLLQTDGGRWYLVSPSGHRWSLPSPGAGTRWRPILSSDGRMLGYLTASGSFVVRDLVTGRSDSFAGFSPSGESEDGRMGVDVNLPGYFSPDDNELALPGGPDGTGNGVVVLTLDTHRTYTWTQRAYIGDFLAGWLDNDRLALVDRTTTPWLLDVRNVRGGTVSSLGLIGTSVEDGGGFDGWDQLTTDRGSLDVVAGQTQDYGWLIDRYDVRTGRLLRTISLPHPVQGCVRADGPDSIVTSAWRNGQTRTVQETGPGGTTRTVTSLSQGLQPACVELTAAAASGGARAPMLLDRATDLLATRWQWLAAALAVGVASRLVLRLRRR